MSLIAQLLLYSFFEISKDLKIRKNPLQKYLKNYKATPSDYTIVKLHIV